MSFNVLVADSSTRTRQDIVQALQEIGVGNVVETADGEEAISQFNQGQFDLVAFDWNLASQKGRNFVQEIRQQNKGVPIIVTSTDAESEVALEADKAGASDFLIKPFSNDRLRQILDKYVGATTS